MTGNENIFSICRPLLQSTKCLNWLAWYIDVQVLVDAAKHIIGPIFRKIQIWQRCGRDHTYLCGLNHEGIYVHYTMFIRVCVLPCFSLYCLMILTVRSLTDRRNICLRDMFSCFLMYQ